MTANKPQALKKWKSTNLHTEAQPYENPEENKQGSGKHKTTV